MKSKPIADFAADSRQKPIRVVYLDHTGELGGAEHLLLRLVGSLPPGLVEPILICGQDGPFPKKAAGLGINTTIVKLPRFFSVSAVVGRHKIVNPVALAWDACLLLYSAAQIRRALSTEAVDIIETHSNFAHVIGGLVARSLQVPCVWIFHDFIDRERLCGFFAWTWRGVARWLDCRIIGGSRAVLDALTLGAVGQVIYAGCGESSSEGASLRARLNLSRDEKLVGFVGRIAHIKGLDVLIRSAAEVVKWNDRVHFVAIGGAPPGEGPYRSYLDRMVRDLALGDRWHWYGPSANPPSLMADLDVVVLPSRREAFGLVLLEAGLAGKVCVASRVGGIPEIIVDGETGILVLPSDHEALASSIEALLSDPHRAAAMGAKARERISRIFDPERFTRQFLSLYRSLVI